MIKFIVNYSSILKKLQFLKILIGNLSKKKLCKYDICKLSFKGLCELFSKVFGKLLFDILPM